MAVVSYYQMSDSDLEENADFVKTVILNALVDEGLIDEEKADIWCEEHTILKRKKGFFQTLSEKWRKAKVIKHNSYWFVVKKV